jgi:hypothetical protein
LNNTTGSNNTAAGVGAGSSLTTGDNNIDIGNSGVDGESDTIRIGSEFQTRTFIAVIRVTTGIADAVNVVIAQIQKVSAQLEVSGSAPQTVLNNQ